MNWIFLAAKLPLSTLLMVGGFGALLIITWSYSNWRAAVKVAFVAVLNLRDSQISGEVVRAAVGQHAGEAWFEARAESNLGRLSHESLAEAGIRVPVVGIRDLLARFPEGRVDVVKMDIEGGEEELLGRDTDWLGRIKALMVEWHEDRVDSRPLIRNVDAAGFQHQRINCERQDNLSLFLRS